MAISFLDLALLAAVLWLLNRYTSNKRAHPLPPGPKGLPLPPTKQYLKFSEWGLKYGNIVHISVLGQPVIILSDVKTATAMLEKKGSFYSDRPVLEMCGELAGWKEILPLQQAHGPRFKEMRRSIHRLIGTPAAVARFHELFEAQTRGFLRRMLTDPRSLGENIRNTAGAIILMLAYGYTIKEDNDPVLAVVELAMGQFSELTQNSSGDYLVDAVPLLKHIPAWMPGGGFKRTAKECYKTSQKMVDIPFQTAKKELEDGMALPSFFTMNMEGKHLSEYDEDSLKWAAGSFYAGGTDTTVSAIHTFYLAMTLFPEVQRKAQEEIDAVIGNDRLPTMADRANLPYVEALLSEIFRWRPVVPGGSSHVVTQDDIHDGYFIPKGSFVFANAWHLLHDPAVYENPDRFDPSRFIPRGNKPAEQDPRVCSFGFGRRICPGLHLADATVWLSIAMSLAVFDVSTSMEDGVAIAPSGKYLAGLIAHPEPFRCEIKPRSAQTHALILAQ
ncbi:cytochrome P450 [Artomyces pyxidatus]|uniref:Cytochrome P450 n=1 Tax=Artomyces pyxidatus TaxID=48021 RepID=A0ACB8TLE9_9AGAM|nr:cytochrome P450 [Artomyces pyxidatus]